MEIQNFFESMREIQDLLLIYAENNDNIDTNLHNLIMYINDQQKQWDKEDIEHFLHLLSSIINNHHKETDFYEKMVKILTHYSDKIKQTLSNATIYDIFKKNKTFLLFLIENKIIEFDEQILARAKSYSNMKDSKYFHFFYPEVKKLVEKGELNFIEKELLEYDSNIFNNFDEKRHKGENERFICELIRKDSIEDFIVYINKTNISLRSTIKPSLFETNSFLLKKGQQTTLIEYAAFYGSIQIFRYLMLNKVELTPSIFEYAIHSNNAELIYLLIEKQVVSPNNYKKYLYESIKCHHNSIANYIQENLIEQTKDQTNYNKNIVLNSIRYDNYSYFPTNFNERYIFVLLCRYKYYKIVDDLLNSELDHINEIISKYSIEEMANNNKLEAIYYLLSKQNIIKKNQFRSCSNLEQICIPPSIKEIDKCAFKKCKSLKVIIIPSSVKFIRSAAFSHCSSLTKITIPSSVIKMGNYAFYKCNSLLKINLSESLKSIKSDSFSECISLNKITIPSSVTEIGTSAFYLCSSLKKITIHSPTISIKDNAFNSCSNLKQIFLFSPTTSINENAFYNCSAINHIIIPSSISPNSVYFLGKFHSIESITVFPCKKEKIENYEEKIFIYKTKSNKKMYGNLFLANKKIDSLTIPPFVTSIGNKAFVYCFSLTQVFIPSSVTSIRYHAFERCSSLIEVLFETPSHLTSIESFAFRGCSKLKQIIIPSSVTSIGNLAFHGCSSLIEVLFETPSHVTSIGNLAFFECIALTHISILSLVENIGSDASIKNCTFYKCSNLMQIAIPLTLKSIGEYAFAGCSSLTNIIIPFSVKNIESCAFRNCKSLTKVTILSPETCIESSLFLGCSSLKEIIMPSSLMKHENAIRKYTNAQILSS